MSLHSRHKVFSSPQICIYSEQNSENRAQDDALFWILILGSLYVQPQLSVRKGNETEDDRKAFPVVNLTVTMACLLSV